MDSSRLPGKVLLDIGGRPMLQWVVERTRRAKTVDEVIVATTTDPSDDAVAQFCEAKGYPVTRGSIHDVLDRYYQTARQFKADVIVRITADCPLIDPALVDGTVFSLFEIGDWRLKAESPISNLKSPIFDFVANRLPPPWGRTYPIGLDTEVFTFDALERAWKRAIARHHREHVTPYFYEDTPVDHLKFSVQGSEFSSAMTLDGLHIALLHHDPDYGRLRWTVDTPADLELVRAIVAHFDSRDDFTWQDVLAIFEREPELAQINASVRHKTHLDVDDRSVNQEAVNQ